MENIDKAIVVNVGVNAWYAIGSSRLERSLIFNGFPGQMLIYKELYPDGSPNHNDNPYAFKVYAVQEAINRGFQTLLLLDSSFWAIKDITPIFDIIADKGIFGFRTGYNCAQTCSDAALEWAGITRDEAEQLPEIASGAVGLRLENPDGKYVWEKWKEGMELGLFKTNRVHDIKDSSDPRFIHGRQDQSIYSLAIHMRKLIVDDADYVAYYNSGNPGYDKNKCCFFIGGL
jgi:hypothetical protein